MGLTGGVAGGVTVLTPFSPMGTLMSDDVVPLVVFWDEGELGIIMYGACTESTHRSSGPGAHQMCDVRVLASDVIALATCSPVSSSQCKGMAKQPIEGVSEAGPV